jgi:hypothetical protein
MGTPVQLAWSNFELVNFLPCRVGTGDDLLAKLVNQPQSIRAGVKNPTSGYSRVVSCMCHVGALPGKTFCACRSGGENVWLLQVKVWASFRPDDPMPLVRFRVKTGFAPTEDSVKDNIENWDDVIPVTGTLSGWGSRFYDWAFSWDLKRLYAGTKRWFGLYIDDPGGTMGMLFASFQISEG